MYHVLFAYETIYIRFIINISCKMVFINLIINIDDRLFQSNLQVYMHSIASHLDYQGHKTVLMNEPSLIFI